MDGSHLNHYYQHHHHHHHHELSQAMSQFPPAFAAPQSVIPAKREDDDVQFVSSNPVKKRRIEAHCPVAPRSATTTAALQSPPQPPPSVLLAPTGILSHCPQPLESAMESVPPPERRGSTGMVDPSPTTHMSDPDPMRGCSVPIPQRSEYAESFWTAPSTGPQSSPPVSPKSLPGHVAPSMLRLQDHHGLVQATGGTVGGYSGLPANTDPDSQPPSTKGKGTPAQPDAADQTQAETTKHAPQADTISQLTGDVDPNGNIPPVTADERDMFSQQLAAGLAYNHSCASAGTKPAITSPSALDCQRAHNHNPPRTSQHTHHHTLSPGPVASIAHAAGQVPAHGTTSTQPDACGNRPVLGAKGPCRQCLEARMRQQAASSLPPGAKFPVAVQHSMPSSTIQQPWAPLLGINPYHNPMSGAVYGPMLQQPMMSAPNTHFALPQQQPRLPQAPSSHQTGGQIISLGPSPSGQPTQNFVPAASSNPKSATSPIIAQTWTASDTQNTNKHIIVDIADTCLSVFPFDEVAKRHNQPEQKVRDVFSAVIQVPLLRCVTDKRRAGKLGTARVKEFTQAKKEIQTKVAAGQTKQDAVHTGPYTPSPLEMAQFMGPGDIRLGVFSQFSGPW